jgi:predicted DNA binding CopG/RHH family protein
MKKEYDFSKGRKNPYSKALKEQITIRLESEVVEYFKRMAEKMGIPYQNLINYYLRDCVTSKKEPVIEWRKTG